jgi:cytochrome c553
MRIVSLLALVAIAAGADFAPQSPNAISFPPHEARLVRLVILGSPTQSCIDELEVYSAGGKENLALATRGARAAASSCLPGYRFHKIEHLNDGRYGNSHSWIAAGVKDEWAEIQLPTPAKVAKVVFSRDREGQYRDRMPSWVEIRVSSDGQTWKKVAEIKNKMPAAQRVTYVPPVPLPDPVTWDGLVRYALLCERETWRKMQPGDHLSPLNVERPALPGGAPYWGRIARLDPLRRTLVQFAEMIERLAGKGLDLRAERRELATLRSRQAQLPTTGPQAVAAEEALYLDARLAKRRLMFRDPDLAGLERILFVRRHPYLSSHNYSDILDSRFRPGGGICVLEIPRRAGRLDPAQSHLVTLFDAADGIARDPMADFDAHTVYFAYRPSRPVGADQDVYWHLMAVDARGGSVRQLTHGPFHDYYPCPLPDGGLAFISTRCKCRFLCWRPQAFVLFRCDADGRNMRPLSYANLSEWSPAVMRDGRILWTRSEYLDKGADFGHTLWAIHPDGTHPELIFGNDTPNCYINGREVPGTREICCTLFSHGGDHNGPLGLVDLGRGPFNTDAITNITPDVTPRYNMKWPREECFRDPVPVARDYFLASHAPADRWGLYVVDRWGNRELLYLDPAIGAMCPSPLRPRQCPPVLPALVPEQYAGADMGQFTLADVYQGLEPVVARGRVKYLRVCQEMRSDLEQLPNGEFRKDHGPVFADWYASPIHKVSGPHGWPSYVAKAALGLVPVEADGSASFYAPAGKVLYFQALDENLNELQRMRSVVQLQPGEKRSCVGCHENRQTTTPPRPSLAARRAPSTIQTPSWGAGALSYERVVQPVWDAQCVRCHDARDKQGLDLTATLDAERVPASYRTLIQGGWVHYFDYRFSLRHYKAAALSFGTLNSPLWRVLDAGHHNVHLTRDQMHRVKCWIDLNCPLWADYTNRLERPAHPALTSRP